MNIHHLNCGSVREIEPTLEGLRAEHVVNHCLLIETDDAGLVLVETGLGLGDIRHPEEWLGAEWIARSQPVLDEQETAIRQIQRLGFSPDDVRHIIVTHLDIDHCGGLGDFPNAVVHVLSSELEAALREAPSYRYRPAHWEHGPLWQTYPNRPTGDWFGFGSIQPKGLPASIQLVPLVGHTVGHVGVAVHDGERWLLHAGDAYYYHLELIEPPQSHPMLDVVQNASEMDHEHRIATQNRLRELVRLHGDEVSVFSAHDPWELDGYRPAA